MGSDSGPPPLGLKQYIDLGFKRRQDDINKIIEASTKLVLPNNYQGLGTYNLQKTEKSPQGIHIGWFCLDQLPGCGGVLISHGVSIVNYRSSGLGEILLMIRVEAARDAQYGLMQATVLETNHHEIHLLAKHGWVKELVFTNPKTNHIVGLWTKRL